jgi:hypothetical protein
MSKNNVSSIWSHVKNEIKKDRNSSENFLDIRNSRQGYRGMGMYQLSRSTAAEGVMVVGVTRGGRVGA